MAYVTLKDNTNMSMDLIRLIIDYCITETREKHKTKYNNVVDHLNEYFKYARDLMSKLPPKNINTISRKKEIKRLFIRRNIIDNYKRIISQSKSKHLAIRIIDLDEMAIEDVFNLFYRIPISTTPNHRIFHSNSY